LLSFIATAATRESYARNVYEINAAVVVTDRNGHVMPSTTTASNLLSVVSVCVCVWIA